MESTGRGQQQQAVEAPVHLHVCVRTVPLSPHPEPPPALEAVSLLSSATARLAVVLRSWVDSAPIAILRPHPTEPSNGRQRKAKRAKQICMLNPFRAPAGFHGDNWCKN
ncbi:hypothetical protein H920_19676 [Fukomys damarensis]|uniref:Uncharacterized protein n=1 Tax=Fukomys damarensis TaxID=885580 RepID=A0A091CM44_FUKDA|nr:hypothetical protein H920_19676 [Fukomys damarensis]